MGVNNVMNNNLTWNVSKASYFSFPDQSKDNNQEYLGIPFVIHNSNLPNTIRDQNYKRYCSQCFDISNPSSPCSSCSINSFSPQHADFQDYNRSLTDVQGAITSLLPNVRMGVSTDDLGRYSRGPHRAIHLHDYALYTTGERWKSAGITNGTPIESKVIYAYDAVVKQSNGSYQLTAPAGFDRYFWVLNDNGIYTNLNTDVTSSGRVFTTPTPSSNYTSITCYMGKSTGQAMGDKNSGWNLVFEMTHPFILSGFQGQKALSVPPPPPAIATSTQVSLNVTASNITWEATENSNWFSISGITG